MPRLVLGMGDPERNKTGKVPIFVLAEGNILITLYTIKIFTCIYTHI